MSLSPPALRIAIVGGGWAGLAAGVWLARHGAAITLFEAGREAGGRARHVPAGGREIDNGQHILLGAYTEALGMMETVSPGSTQRHFLRLPLTLEFPGQFHLALPRLPTPLNLALGLLAAQGLSFKTKVGRRAINGTDQVSRVPSPARSKRRATAGRPAQSRHRLPVGATLPFCIEHAAAQSLREHLGQCAEGRTDRPTRPFGHAAAADQSEPTVSGAGHGPILSVTGDRFC